MSDHLGDEMKKVTMGLDTKAQLHPHIITKMGSKEELMHDKQDESHKDKSQVHDEHD